MVSRIGEQLARLSAGRTPSLFEGRWWSHQALNLAMHDNLFKAQLFRFIDVLPSVTDDEQVVTLAREYLGDGETALFGTHWGL
jgi:RHH-type proline utilization regulon transcriptional repressor/proline dehydrogenase/delta 1-pyrroline-5-carboxylate dehydrogenase